MGRLKLIIGGIIILIAGIVIFDGMFVVHQVQTALVLQFGKPVLPIHSEPGLRSTRGASEHSRVDRPGVEFSVARWAGAEFLRRAV